MNSPGLRRASNWRSAEGHRTFSGRAL